MQSERMRWFEYGATLEIVAQPASFSYEIDGLLFRARRLRRGIELCAAAAASVGLLVLCCFGWSYRDDAVRITLVVVALVALLSVLFSLLRSPLTELRVTGSTVFALGFVDEEAPSTVLLDWATITELRFQAEIEGDPRGLYAETGWGSSCLLPHLDEEQANRVIDAIHRRFPDLGTSLARSTLNS